MQQASSFTAQSTIQHASTNANAGLRQPCIQQLACLSSSSGVLGRSIKLLSSLQRISISVHVGAVALVVCCIRSSRQAGTDAVGACTGCWLACRQRLQRQELQEHCWPACMDNLVIYLLRLPS